jgi:hypothetical protein
MVIVRRSFCSCFALLGLGLGISVCAATSIGEVVLAAGEVWRVPPGQFERIATARGDQILAGDTLLTGEGQLVARMLDGGVVSLRSHTRATVQEYRGEAAGKGSAVRITLEQGTLRSATGSIGETQKSKFRINTPFSALGIRGTDFVTVVDPSGQSLAVLRGSVVLAPFDRGSGCLPDALGACSGPAAVELRASTEESLRLERNASIALRQAGIPEILRPNVSEREYFRVSGLQSGSRLAAGDPRGEPGTAESPVRDASGREILAYDSFMARARFRNSADFPLDPSSVGRYETEQQLRRHAADGSGPALSLEGVLPLPDKAVATPAGLYWFDRSASPVDLAVARFALAEIESRLDAYRLGSFGAIGNYSARALNGLSLSMWVDPVGYRFWGQKNVLSSLMALRGVAEASTIWGVIPEVAAPIAPGALSWLQDVAGRRAQLWMLPLAQQAIVHAPPGPENLDLAPQRVFTLQFQQQLRNFSPDTFWQLRNIEFGELFRQEASFSLLYRMRGESFRLSGSADSEGSFFAADENLEVRGQRTGAALLLMVSKRDGSNQWMLGYAEASERLGATPSVAALISPSLISFVEPSGARWGRWSHFAQLSPEDARRLLGDVPMLQNTYFALATPTVPDLPSRGRFDFLLEAYEALYSKAGQLRPADVSNAALSVDFDKAHFATRFDVRAPGTDLIEIRGQGGLSSHGLLKGSPSESNALLQGVLGRGGRNASMLFERSLGVDERVSGITHWTR